MTSLSALLAVYWALLAAAAFLDLKEGVVPNWMSLLVLAIGLPLAYFAHEDFSAWRHVVSFVIALFGGVLLFATRFMGGGAVKFGVAVAVAFTPGEMLFYLMVTAIVGGLVALAVIAIQRVFGDEDSQWAVLSRIGSVPFAPAIATGAGAASIRFFA